MIVSYLNVYIVSITSRIIPPLPYTKYSMIVLTIIENSADYFDPTELIYSVKACYVYLSGAHE